MPPVQTAGPPVVDEDTMNSIRRRLLETGDWDRISKLLRAKLEEAGYADDLKDFAKERARQQEDPKLDALLSEVMAKARDMLDPSLRSAVQQEISAVLDTETDPVR